MTTIPPPQNEINPPHVNARAVAEVLAVDLATVYRQAHQGRLPFLRIGRAMRFDLNEVLRALGRPALTQQQRLTPPTLDVRS